jgi:hypothetical protein
METLILIKGCRSFGDEEKNKVKKVFGLNIENPINNEFELIYL